MAEILAQVVLPSASGLPENNVVNTFAFLTPSVGIVTSEVTAVATDLAAFYTTNPGGQAIGAYIGEHISRSLSARIKFYDLTGHLDGTPHGSPFMETTFVLPASAVGSELPAEVAICISFQAAYGADAEFGPGTRPRSRDRGRVFIGPLTGAVLFFDATQGDVRVISTARVDFKNAAKALRDSTTSAWAVWSRKNAVLEPVVSVWVDDAIDIQRRRGVKPSTRTSG